MAIEFEDRTKSIPLPENARQVEGAPKGSKALLTVLVTGEDDRPTVSVMLDSSLAPLLTNFNVTVPLLRDLVKIATQQDPTQMDRLLGVVYAVLDQEFNLPGTVVADDGEDGPAGPLGN
jgi:hypothetical protein